MNESNAGIPNSKRIAQLIERIEAAKARYERACKEVEKAKNEVNSAECELWNAQNALGKVMQQENFFTIGCDFELNKRSGR